MKIKMIFKPILLALLLSLFFHFPVFASQAGEHGKLLFQFRFMNVEESNYRLEFLQSQLDFFDFEQSPELNKNLMVQLLILLNENFSWEERNIAYGMHRVDFNASLEEIYDILFQADSDRNYLLRLADEQHLTPLFDYLKSLYGQYPRYKDIFFVGDSRFVGIRDYTSYDSRCHFVAEIGTGYPWFAGAAYSSLVQHRDNLGGNIENAAVVINLGVNDLVGGGPFDGLAAQYAALVNDHILPLGFDVYYMSVNPVHDGSCSAAGIPLSNGKVENFNENLRTRLSEDVFWLDIYSWFHEVGLGYAGDGLHYPAGTNQAIIDETLHRLGN